MKSRSGSSLNAARYSSRGAGIEVFEGSLELTVEFLGEVGDRAWHVVSFVEVK